MRDREVVGPDGELLGWFDLPPESGGFDVAVQRRPEDLRDPPRFDTARFPRRDGAWVAEGAFDRGVLPRIAGFRFCCCSPVGVLPEVPGA